MTTDAVIPVEKCRPHERNYNAHSEAQIKDLAESLRQFGQVRSIVVQAQKGGAFLLVAGHGIWLAAKKAGLKELRANVIPASWSKTKVLAYLAADNELSKRGSPDEEQLAAIVRDVCEAEGEAMAALAAGERAALDKILAIESGDADAKPQTDRAEELREKWRTEMGQLWAIGPHRLLCGDSTRREDVERVMGGKKADCVLTDPPYGVDYDGGTKKREKLEGDDTADLYFPFLKTAREFCCNHVAVYLFYADGDAAVTAAVTAAGYETRNNLIWNKNQAQFGALSAQYKQKHEPFLYAHLKGKSPQWFGPTNETTVWDIERGKSNEFHPTQKPPALFMRAISNSTIAQNVVFDGFAGSGTTLVACQNLGRVCRAIEISPAYCAVILERMITAFPTLDIHKVD